jgi:signal transduction histidine kinase
VDIGQVGDTAALVVRDTGPGIPEEEREQVFGRFYRREGQQHLPGAGLGLSIVQRIAALHDARIELHTPPWGQGLEVRVALPCTPAAAVARN